MPPNYPGCLSALSAKLPTRCSPKPKALAHLLKVAVWSSGQVWTSDPHGSMEWTKLSNSLPLDSPMWNGSDASRGTILSQGLCEIQGGHLCQVQLKQPEKDQVCSDESGCVSICNQILLASYFHLQNHGTSHLASSTPPPWKSIHIFLEFPGPPLMCSQQLC